MAERWRSERVGFAAAADAELAEPTARLVVRGPDPDGFMTSAEVVAVPRGLRRARSPRRSHTGVTVIAVERERARVPGGRPPPALWHAANVVIATGHCDTRQRPAGRARALAPDIVQVVPTSYRNPAQLPDGGGAGGRRVRLGRPARRRDPALRPPRDPRGGRAHPRCRGDYRGRDIMAWLDAMGVLRRDRRAQVPTSRPRAPAVAAARRATRPPLARPRRPAAAGRAHRRAALARRRGPARGTSPTTWPRRSRRAEREDAPAARPHRRVHRSGHRGEDFRRSRPGPARCPCSTAPAAIDLRARPASAPSCGRPDTAASYPWLELPVLDARGELRHAAASPRCRACTRSACASCAAASRASSTASATTPPIAAPSTSSAGWRAADRAAAPDRPTRESRHGAPPPSRSRYDVRRRRRARRRGAHGAAPGPRGPLGARRRPERSRQRHDSPPTRSCAPGVLQLQRWGLLDARRAAGTPPIRRTTFHYGEDAVAVRSSERDGVDALYAPRRTVLDVAAGGRRRPTPARRSSTGPPPTASSATPRAACAGCTSRTRRA